MKTKVLDSVKEVLKSKPARIAIGVIGISALAGIMIKNKTKIAPDMLEETEPSDEEILLVSEEETEEE